MSFSFGIDIGGSNIKIGLVEDKGKVVARRRLKTDLAASPNEVLTRIADFVDTLGQERKVDSIGVGVAGLIDHKEGVVLFSPNLPLWRKVPVKETLSRLTGLEVFCANDANAAVLGEWLYGVARGYKNVLGITLGTGVGSGIIVNNQLLLGGNNFAGELGHSTISLKGFTCSCGNRGCLECYVGAEAIANRARSRLRKEQRGVVVNKNQLALFANTGGRLSKIFELVGYDLRKVTPKEIGFAARKGDSLALAVIKETGELLGRGIYNAIMLFDPEVVVLGGGVSKLGRPLLKAVKESVFSRLYGGERKLKFFLSRLGSDAGVLGASQLSGWLAKFL